MIESALLGFISGSAVLIGALLGLYLKLNNKLIATIMAFGADVLISALSIDLMDDAFDKSHDQLAIGLSFLAGAIVFVGGDYLIDKKGGQFRKRGHGISEKSKSDNPKTIRVQPYFWALCWTGFPNLLSSAHRLPSEEIPDLCL